MSRILILLNFLAFTVLQPASAQYRSVSPVIAPIVISQDGLVASSGIAIDLAKEAAARAGISLSLEIQPWARAYDTGTKNINIFLLPVVKTPEREPLFEWLGPINRYEFKLYRLKSSKAPTLRSPQEIGDNSVGVMNGIFVHDYLKNAKFKDVQTTTNFQNLAAMFFIGRFSYLVSTRPLLRTELAKTNLTMDAVEEQFTFDIDSPDAHSHLVLAKGSDPALVQEMKKALLSMQKDGTWNKIFQKYQ